MNTLPSFYTTQITCIHSSYTPPLWHALPYVYQLTSTELTYCKFYINKNKHSLNIEYFLLYENVFKYNKQSNNSIPFLPVPSHWTRLLKTISNLELNISTEVTCCHQHFLHSSKFLDLFHLSFLFADVWFSLTCSLK